ncbi:BspA family leucine-rich repeat surface protein [Lactobacillus sp. DCY120]|uniref:BspA family leucine-rich repeat surface protein n=1 Tax=Bombilactobacillus apium TaxID=2675299 RepID=A0A850R6S0_9LACO|nr:BspA family leucine-rich repeat surface protein [Bombilactobacillus apium]NVY96342.1 BspA family leucine-rich repeat surface protein [Bombilactobacillus apium]
MKKTLTKRLRHQGLTLALTSASLLCGAALNAQKTQAAKINSPVPNPVSQSIAPAAATATADSPSRTATATPGDTATTAKATTSTTPAPQSTTDQSTKTADSTSNSQTAQTPTKTTAPETKQSDSTSKPGTTTPETEKSNSATKPGTTAPKDGETVSPTTDQKQDQAPAATDKVNSSSTTEPEQASTNPTPVVPTAPAAVENTATTTPTPPAKAPDPNPGLIAQGVWGSSKWEFSQQGNDYLLHFHEGTLGRGQQYFIDKGHDFGSIGGDSQVFDKNQDWINKLTLIQFDQGVYANEISDYLFYHLINLRKIIGIANLNTSRVKQMNSVFRGTNSLEYIDISSWDTSNVQGMSKMFSDASGTLVINVGNIDTSKVTDMGGMFMGAWQLKHLDLSGFQTGNVRDMEAMFAWCNSLISLNLSHFDTRNANTSGMLTSTDNLRKIILGTQTKLGVDSNLNDVPRIGTKVPGVPYYKVKSSAWISISGSNVGSKYNAMDVKTSNRDQITIYQWDQEPFFRTTTENRTVTRTINLHLADGSTQTKIQNATISRTITLNDDGTRSTGAWSTAQWDEYQVPTITGYQPSQNTVAVAKVTEQSGNKSIDINYSLPKSTIEVQYISQGKVINRQQFTGADQEVIHPQYNLPQNYRFVKQPDATLTITEAPQIITIEITPQIQQNTEYREVVRTINLHRPDGSQQVIKQVAQIQRTIQVNLVDQTQTPSAWSTAQWEAYQIPAIAGFQPSQKNVDTVTIDGSSKNQVLDITYQADQSTITIQYVSQGKVIGQQKYSGAINDQIYPQYNLPQNYQFVNQPAASMTITSQPQTISVEVTPKVQSSTEYRNVVRTINIHKPDGTQEAINQVAQIQRTVQTNLVDQTKTAGDWSTAQWDAYQTPTIDGYQASQEQVAAATVNGQSKNQVVDISYQAQSATVTIQYVSQGKVVGEQKVNGQVNEKVYLQYKIPHYYQVQGSNPDQITLTKADQTITVEVSPQIQSSTEYHNVVRTINLHNPDGSQKVINQVAQIKRTVQTNLVDQSKTVGDWSSAQWDAYEIPSIAGYQPSQTSVAAVSVTDQTQNQVVDIDYQPQAATVTIQYVYQGKVIAQQQYDGNIDETIYPQYKVPKNYQLVKQPATHITLDQPAQTVTVEIEPQIKESTEYYNAVRTINVHQPDGSQKVISQVAQIQRTIKTNLVDQTKAAGAWSTAQWEAYHTPSITGYDPSQATIEATAVTEKTANQTVDITYTAQEAQLTIQYVADGKVVGTEAYQGAVNETIHPQYDLPQNYRLIQQTIPSIKLTQQAQTITVNVTPQLANSTEQRSVTRTINLHQPDGTQKVIKQVAQIQRTITTNLVDQTQTKGAWSTAQWKQYATPEIAGYTPSQTQINASAVNEDTTDQIIDITYAAKENQVTIQYVANGQVIAQQQVGGKVNETIHPQYNLPQNYQFVKQPAATITVGEQAQTITIAITPKMESNVEHQNVVRTININQPDGTQKVIQQVAKIQRTITTNLVTKTQTAGKWSTAQWDEYDLPVVNGFTPSQTKVDAVTVDGNTGNQTVEISYQAQKNKVTIQYVANGKVVGQQEINGQVNETVYPQYEAPKNYQLVGQPSDSVTISDQPQTITVAVTPKIQASVEHYNIVRTINLHKPDGSQQVITQVAQIQRTVKINLADQSRQEGDWSTAQWDAYQVPTIADSHPNVTEIAAQTVDITSQSQVVDVYYMA